MDSPALDKVLSTLELLDNIFSRLSRRDNTRNALVCRKWTDPARDHIWRLVETPCQLFRILAPVTCPSKSAHTNNINHTIARIPTQADWRRFRPIATRVRGLQVTAHSDTKCRASLSIILSDIAVSRPNDGILPNLRFVDLVGTSLPHGYIMLFLSLNLTSLTSSIPDDSVDYNLSDFLEDLSTSAPNLQTLSLVATRSRGHRVKTCQTALGKLPTLFPHLTCLKLPLYFLTSTVLEALADSPIVGIDFSETRNSLENAGDVRDIASINPNLRNNSLSSLRRLSICGRLRELTEMLSHEHFPAANLNDLVIRTTSAETEQAVRGLIALLAERFNSLGSLYLLLTPSSQSLGDGADPAIAWARDEDHEPLTMDTIRPLSDMRQLQRFSVLHSKPLDLDDDDIRYLTERLPNLRRLVLNPLPRARLGTPRLTLLSLMHIANHCPRIHSIALYADAASPTISYPIYIPTPLPKVYLQLSGSLLSTATRSEVAKYLSRILRPGVALKTAISVFYDVPFHVPSNGWQWITDRLSLLIDVRQEERMLQRGRQDLERQTADRTEQGTPNNTTESEEYPTH